MLRGGRKLVRFHVRRQKGVGTHARIGWDGWLALKGKERKGRDINTDMHSFLSPPFFVTYPDAVNYTHHSLR